MSRMMPVGMLIDASGMLSAKARDRQCACGRTFTQRQMAIPQLEAMERMGVIEPFMRAVPDGYVPVHCPPCETRDLGRQARIDESRAHSPSPATFSHTLPDRRPA